MRALVLDSQDSLFDSRWSGANWDEAIDLGLAGAATYADWSNCIRCPVSCITALRRDHDSDRLHDLLNFARGKVVDDLGLDWWDLNSVFFYQQLDQMTLLARLAASWQDANEIVVSRPGLHARILRVLLGDRVHVVARHPWSKAGAHFKHYGRALAKLSLTQLREILGDKYDSDYSLRHRFGHRASSSIGPVVLLPSAYSNASKILAAYARIMPEQQFLLVATRHSATLFEAPQNMHVASLAAYADSRRSPGQFSALVGMWNELLAEMQQVPELKLLAAAGALDDFPRLMATGLALREAWVNVFNHHDVRAVFSGDEGNPYVCLPLKLGAQRGIPSISVHHGALDGRFVLKDPVADLCLVKSRMELDYLTRVCGLDTRRIILGAPGQRPTFQAVARSGTDVVFFSEPYEIFGGRTDEIYRELLPTLCRIAAAAGRKVLVKLHPFESSRGRRHLLRTVLPPEDRNTAQIVSGPMTEGLFDRTWFGITVQSTVAMECALRGIPCFLCDWLADSLFGYARQFAKFGVGSLLRSPAEIPNISRRLDSYEVSPAMGENLWSPMPPDTLRQLLSGAYATPVAAAVG